MAWPYSPVPLRTALLSTYPEWIVRGWRTVTGVHNYEPHHLEQAVDLLAGSRIDWQSVTDGPITLSQVPEAFHRSAGEGMRRVVDLSES